MRINEVQSTLLDISKRANMSEELEQFKSKCSKLVKDEKYRELLTSCETKLEELNKTTPDDKEFLAYIYFAIGYAKGIGLENYDNAIEYYNKVN